MAVVTHIHTSTGATLIAAVLNAAGEWWNTATEAFETFNAANLTDYAISLTESPAGSYQYRTTVPVDSDTFARIRVWEEASLSLGILGLCDAEYVQQGILSASLLTADAVQPGAAAAIAAAASSVNVSVPRVVAAEAINAGSNIQRQRATKWTITVEQLSELPAGNKVYFTLKSSYDDADADAKIQVRLTLAGDPGDDGLQILGGEDVSATRSDEAAIVYESYVEDGVTYYRATVTVEGDATVDVDASRERYVWDIKSVGDDDQSLYGGTMLVTPIATLAVT